MLAMFYLNSIGVLAATCVVYISAIPVEDHTTDSVLGVLAQHATLPIDDGMPKLLQTAAIDTGGWALPCNCAHMWIR